MLLGGDLPPPKPRLQVGFSWEALLAVAFLGFVLGRFLPPLTGPDPAQVDRGVAREVLFPGQDPLARLGRAASLVLEGEPEGRGLLAGAIDDILFPAAGGHGPRPLRLLEPGQGPPEEVDEDPWPDQDPGGATQTPEPVRTPSGWVVDPLPPPAPVDPAFQGLERRDPTPEPDPPTAPAPPPPSRRLPPPTPEPWPTQEPAPPDSPRPTEDPGTQDPPWADERLAPVPGPPPPRPGPVVRAFPPPGQAPQRADAGDVTGAERDLYRAAAARYLRGGDPARAAELLSMAIGRTVAPGEARRVLEQGR